MLLCVLTACISKLGGHTPTCEYSGKALYDSGKEVGSLPTVPVRGKKEGESALTGLSPSLSYKYSL